MQDYGDAFDQEIDARIADADRQYEGAQTIAPTATSCSPFYQPDANGPIYKDTPEGRVVWRGWFTCAGRYYASAEAWREAIRLELECAHADALHEDVTRRQLRTLAEWYLARHGVVDSSEGAAEHIARATRRLLGRSLNTEHRAVLVSTLTTLIAQRTGFELTEKGRRALASSNDNEAQPVEGRRVG